MTTSFNIINPLYVASYLKDFALNENVAELLVIALENPLKKRPENIRVVPELPEDAQEWLKSKWDKYSEWHEFYPRKDIRLAGKVAIIARWLYSAVQNNEEWLKKLDAKGRPKKLVNIGTLDQALHIAKKYEDHVKSKYDPESKTDIMDVDISFVDNVSNDIHVVKLLTPKALDRESDFLGHCIGNDGYDSALLNRESVFYSFRDIENKPLMTLQADYLTKRLVQCRTKNNGRAKDKLLECLNVFAKKYGIYSHEMVCDFYLFAHGQFSNDIYDLSHLDTISGNLTYHNPERKVFLAKKLTFNGNLSFYGYNFKNLKLPSDISVVENFSIISCPFIKKLPRRIVVGNSFDLAFCPLIKDVPPLPRVAGHYQIISCRNLETIMGNDINAGFGIHIDNCPKLDVLPQVMISQDFISISNCPSLKVLPKKLHSKNGLRIMGCDQLQELPEDFYIKGFIYTEFGVFDCVETFRKTFDKIKRSHHSKVR